MKKFITTMSLLCLVVFLFSSCGKNDGNGSNSDKAQRLSVTLNTDGMNLGFSDSDIDYDYDEANAEIIDGSEKTVEITTGGNYVISGEQNGIIVSAGENDKVKIILKNAEISSNNGPAIYISSADKVFITAYEGTQNTISDGEKYSGDYFDENADGAVFSKADLTLNGRGTLTVNGNYKSAVVSKDDLVLCGLTLNAKSINASLEGKDCVKIKDADISVNAGGDGIKSTNSEDGSKGFVYVESGNIKITSVNDGVQAETLLKLSGGELNIASGGGAPEKVEAKNEFGSFERSNTSTDADEESAKGLKSGALILITDGNVTVSSFDDAVHSNGDIQIDGGFLSLESGDDGIHADSSVIINGGEISVLKSYEGIEGKIVSITGGTHDITAEDDGINASDGSDSGNMPMGGGTDGVFISVSGGYTLVNASGDGVDSNGDFYLMDGVLLVSGPTDDGNGALDTGGVATVTGGVAIFCGSKGMAETFSDSSDQCSFIYNLDNQMSDGHSVCVVDSSGRVIASFIPSKQYTSVVVTSPELKKGGSYTLSFGGTVSGCDKNGYTDSGTLSGAVESLEVEITSKSTVKGNSGGAAPGGMGGFRPDGEKRPDGDMPNKSDNRFERPR